MWRACLKFCFVKYTSQRYKSEVHRLQKEAERVQELLPLKEDIRGLEKVFLCTGVACWEWVWLTWSGCGLHGVGAL